MGLKAYSVPSYIFSGGQDRPQTRDLHSWFHQFHCVSIYHRVRQLLLLSADALSTNSVVVRFVGTFVIPGDVLLLLAIFPHEFLTTSFLILVIVIII